MESVEVWMWLIAGVMLGSIIFVSAFMFLGNYIKNVEISQAEQSFDELRSIMDNVCLGGRSSQEVHNLHWPYLVTQIFVEDEHQIKGEGQTLCFNMHNIDPKCRKLDLCMASMSTVDLESKTSVFYMVQKALGRTQPAEIRFTVSKVQVDGESQLNVTWKRVLS